MRSPGTSLTYLLRGESDSVSQKEAALIGRQHALAYYSALIDDDHTTEYSESLDMQWIFSLGFETWLGSYYA